MIRCRWDRERQDYVADGEFCRTDEYGDPTHHCTARRSCANHVGIGELTCARCIGRTRANLRRIVEIAPLMGVQALGSGVDSEAAWLAAPAADVRGFSQRRIAMQTYLLTMDALARITPTQYAKARANMEDDDEWHAYTVLCRWQMMLAEDYGHELPAKMTTTAAGAYLDRTLGRMAQDDEQDFPLFAREMRDCRNHLEAVLRNSHTPERGAPCPDCRDEGHVVRLNREYGHWCDKPDCDRLHYSVVFDKDAGGWVPDTTDDRWVCPRDRKHWRTHDEYAKWIEDRSTPHPSASA